MFLAAYNRVLYVLRINIYTYQLLYSRQLKYSMNNSLHYVYIRTLCYYFRIHLFMYFIYISVLAVIIYNFGWQRKTGEHMMRIGSCIKKPKKLAIITIIIIMMTLLYYYYDYNIRIKLKLPTPLRVGN